jgi:hypothetical protein
VIDDDPGKSGRARRAAKASNTSWPRRSCHTDFMEVVDVTQYNRRHRGSALGLTALQRSGTLGCHADL